jgi:hypothetical protein
MTAHEKPNGQLWNMDIMEAARSRWLETREKFDWGPWNGRHPLLEEFEELLDAYNYEIMMSPGSNRAATLFSLATDLQRTIRAVNKAGIDLTKWDEDVEYEGAR